MRDKVFIYEPMAGEDIRTSIKNAGELACIKEVPVKFKFNGVEMVISEFQTEEEMNYPSRVAYFLNVYKWKLDERNKVYRESDEYKKQEQERKERQETTQEKLNDHVSALEVINTNKDLLLWLKEFTILADTVGVTYDKEYVLIHLDTFGFEENAYVGYEGEWTFIKSIRWLFGQVINCINRFGCPHQVTIYKCDELLKELEEGKLC